MLHSCYRRTGGVVRVGEPDDRVLAETAEGLREPEVGRSGEGGSSPGMGTRVRNPSTTKARGPGETTRRHGPRHVRARASDEARGSVPGDRLGAGRGLAQGESRLPRGRSTPGSVTGQSGWKSGSRACGGRPKRSTSRIGPVHASCPVELRRGPGGGDGRDRRASVADVVSPGSFRRGFTGCSGVSVQGCRVT